MNRFFRNIMVSVIVVIILVGLTDTSQFAETLANNENSNITEVEVAPESELGKQIAKMDERIYGEGNKYKTPVLINEEELIGSWKISNSLIEFYPDGRFQYFMTSEKTPVRCQMGTYAYVSSEKNHNSGQEYTIFTLNIEHMMIDDMVIEFRNVVPYVITGSKEENDYAVINMTSSRVSAFTRVGDELNDPLLNVEDFRFVTMEEFQKAFEALY